MEYEADLGRLEHIVEKLLQDFNDLQEEKRALEATLQKKELQLTEMQEAAAKLKEEKSFIHQRVSGLIHSLEKWEAASASQPESPAETGQEASEQQEQYKQADLGLGG